MYQKSILTFKSSSRVSHLKQNKNILVSVIRVISFILDFDISQVPRGEKNHLFEIENAQILFVAVISCSLQISNSISFSGLKVYHIKDTLDYGFFSYYLVLSAYDNWLIVYLLMERNFVMEKKKIIVLGMIL